MEDGIGATVVERYYAGSGSNKYLSGVKVRLDNSSGSYRFRKAVEKPAIVPNTYEMPLTLKVDFSKVQMEAPVKTEAPSVSEESREDPKPSSGETKENGEPSLDDPAPSVERKQAEEVIEKTVKQKPLAAPAVLPNTSNRTIAPGTYRVSANIWFQKETTGLPMNPHLTNGTFPPSEPVSKNATLTVDRDGNATVVVPITIQPQIMSVKSIGGLPIVAETRSVGRLTSVTVALGKLDNTRSAVRKSCSANIEMGDLAMQISGLSKSHNWPATFQMNFRGLPSSGGGTLTQEQKETLETMSDQALSSTETTKEKDAEGRRVISGKGTLERASATSSVQVPKRNRLIIGGVAGALAVLAAVYAILRKRG